jgi:hypothetical protein
VNAILKIIIDSDVPIFLKYLNDRIESLSKNSLTELRNLINDLKIYFIGLSITENVIIIKPWSVIGRYVRRAIIIYEKMSFEKLVILCKQSATQFKNLSVYIAKHRQKLCGSGALMEGLVAVYRFFPFL